jgi:SNF2 family DNA or RNA helicase
MDNKTREAQLEKFKNNSDCRVLLISLKCGSLGLNLTVANVVILLDIWWNPAIEDQAIDRVHRIGQDKPVKVYKFLIKDTVEDNIIRLQDKKVISNLKT